MPKPKIVCTLAGSRVKALVKQYNSIKDKQRPTDVDESQPPKSEMRRLKLLSELIRADFDIIHALSDKIASVTAEWYQALQEIEDETATAAANMEYENCRVETGWEDVMSIHCGHLTLLLDKAHQTADNHAEALATKIAEAESSSHTNGSSRGNQNRQGNGSANSAHQSHAHPGGTFGSPTGHFREKHSDERVFEEDETEDEQPRDPRQTSRFYRGITLPPATTPETAIATAMAAIHLELPPCPAFDGNITEYNTFRDRFINVVEATGRRLTDRDKMATLLQLLKGKPARMCTGFPISDANYWRVLDMLADEYDHQEELEQILLQQLCSLPAPRDSRHDLNEFYIDASRLLRQLEDMGSNYNTRDVLQALQSKLPQHVLSCILRGKKAGCTWNTAALMNCLHTEVQHAREL